MTTAWNGICCQSTKKKVNAIATTQKKKPHTDTTPSLAYQYRIRKQLVSAGVRKSATSVLAMATKTSAIFTHAKEMVGDDNG
jgi:hypothetical protein